MSTATFGTVNKLPLCAVSWYGGVVVGGTARDLRVELGGKKGFVSGGGELGEGIGTGLGAILLVLLTVVFIVSDLVAMDTTAVGSSKGCALLLAYNLGNPSNGVSNSCTGVVEFSITSNSAAMDLSRLATNVLPFGNEARFTC